jgi:cytosine deaminase
METIRRVALGDRRGTFDITIEHGLVSAITAGADVAPPRWLAMPALANLHAHANRAFAMDGRRPQSLVEAVDVARQERATLTVDDIRIRAARLFQRSIEYGVASIRTHTDIDLVAGMRAIDGVLAAAADFDSALDVEVVAFASAAADPVRPETQSLFAQAVARGALLLGAVPALCGNPVDSLDALLDQALALHVPVDVHLDEHLDAGKALIERLVEGAKRRGLQGRVSVSHGCVLSAMPRDDARRLLDRMAEAQVTLIVLPELNLYLQGRGIGSPRERGLAPVADALAAGVAVRFGTDNVRDWFFPFGDGDMLEAGYVGAITCHVDAAEDLTGLICGGRRGIRVGDLADLVLVPSASFDEAIARRPAGRILIRRGQAVAEEPGRTSAGHAEFKLSS